MISELLVALLSSFIGTLGFGVLLHAPGRSLAWGSLLGALGYLCYSGLMALGLGEGAAMFVGALLASTAAQLLSKKLKIIATVFVTLSIVPFVPGLGLYRFMSSLAQGQGSEGLRYFVSAMSSILMIALGVGVGSFVSLILRGVRRGAKRKKG